MSSESHWIEDTSTTLENLSHGEKLTKFVVKTKDGIEGHPDVEIHGLITESGKFIILSEKFKILEIGEKDQVD